MIYILRLRKAQDIKNLIDAETKDSAICYFAALLHMTQEDLLKIYKIS